MVKYHIILDETADKQRVLKSLATIGVHLEAARMPRLAALNIATVDIPDELVPAIQKVSGVQAVQMNKQRTLPKLP